MAGASTTRRGARGVRLSLRAARARRGRAAVGCLFSEAQAAAARGERAVPVEEPGSARAGGPALSALLARSVAAARARRGRRGGGLLVRCALRSARVEEAPGRGRRRLAVDAGEE